MPVNHSLAILFCSINLSSLIHLFYFCGFYLNISHLEYGHLQFIFEGNYFCLMLLNPTLYDPDNCMAFCIVTGHLVADIWVRTEFRSGNHTMIFKYRLVEIRCWNNIMQCD